MHHVNLEPFTHSASSQLFNSHKAAAGKDNVFKVKIRRQNTFLAQADSEEEMDKWVKAIHDLRVRSTNLVATLQKFYTCADYGYV